MRWWWAVALVVGCGRDAPEDTGEPRERVYSSDWDGVISMLEDHCVTCHNPEGQAAVRPYPESIQLDLLYGEGVYVVAGEPGQSRMWVAIADGLMPAVGPPLEPYQRDHVYDWIAEGAPNDFGSIDFDGDGYSADEGDCDERDATTRPGGNEVCGDGVDNDCSGEVDDPAAIDARDWWPDADGDGYGDAGVAPTHACGPLAGHAAQGGDCDDGDPGRNPGEVEVADGEDDDCDGYVDETTSFADLEPLFTMNCSCHVSGLAGVMVWGSDPRADMVDVPAGQLPAMDLIEPGDPSASYVWQKLNDTQASVGGVGTRMPQNAPLLDAADLARIEAWILDGAPP